MRVLPAPGEGRTLLIGASPLSTGDGRGRRLPVKSGNGAPMQSADIAAVLARQDGVICRSQVLECEGTDSDIARMLRRREWACVFPGVYVNHTGPPSWKQRAWAAVLYHQPAALAGASALRAAGLDVGTESAPIELVVGVAPQGRRSAGCGHPTARRLRGRRPGEPQSSEDARRAGGSPGRVAGPHRGCSGGGAGECRPAAQDDGPTTARGARRPAEAQAPAVAASACYSTWPRARTRRSNGGTSAMSNGRTGCPRGGVSPGRRAVGSRRTAMSATNEKRHWSSWTASWATTGPRIAGTTSTGTSPPPSTATSPCARAGGRCWTPAGWPRRWPRSCRPAAGRTRRSRARAVVSSGPARQESSSGTRCRRNSRVGRLADGPATSAAGRRRARAVQGRRERRILDQRRRHDRRCGSSGGSPSSGGGPWRSRNRCATRAERCRPAVATSTMPAMTSQPASPQLMARNV